MKKITAFLFFLFLIIFSVFSHQKVSAQSPAQQKFYKGIVENVKKEGFKNIFGNKVYYQNLKIRLLEGPNKNKVLEIENSGTEKTKNQKKLNKNDQIVVSEIIEGRKSTYSVWDKYRLKNLVYILVGFFILVIVFAGIKGIGSIIGMTISLSVLLFFIVPQILNGKDPVLISIIGSIIIMFVSIYLAHGFSKKTTIAIVATGVSLSITGILAYFFVDLASLSGLGNEENYALQIGPTNINIKGLLLGGIIIGVLGVLDDITTSQSTAIYEISKANKKLSFTDLIYRGYSIGKEHIASLVNTLVLAYAGASFGLFILFVLNPFKNPYWVILNSEIIVEEIVRTVAGSIGLILAVPITTLIASWVFSENRKIT